MGYNAEILLLVSENTFNRIKSSTTDYAAIKSFLDIADIHNIDSDSGDHLYYWNNVCWNLDTKLMNIIEYFIENTIDSEYLFIRLGRDNDDIEVKGSLCNDKFVIKTLKH